MSTFVKLIQPVYRRQDLSPTRFQYHWRAIHAPIAQSIGLLGNGYVQDHAIGAVPGFQSPGCDGVVEVRFARAEDAAALGEDPAYLEGAKLDEPRFLDLERSVGFLADEEVMVTETTTPATARLVLLLKRADGLGAEEFADRWRAAAGLPPGTLTGHTHCPVLGEDSSERRFDAVDFISWPDALDFEDDWSSDAGRDWVASLGELVDLDASSALLTQPLRVV
jgi:hypothetical protein